MIIEVKVAREVAETEFHRMCDARRIDTDTSVMTGEEREEWDTLREGIIKDIVRGALVIAEDGTPTFTPSNGAGKIFAFHPPTGATLLALETYAGGKNIANLMAAMAEMTHVDRSEFGKLPMRDVTSCIRLAKLFLSDQ